MFIITGSMIIPAISPRVFEQHPPDGVEATERHDVDEGGDLGRDSAVLGHRGRAVGGPATTVSGRTETCTVSWWPW